MKETLKKAEWILAAFLAVCAPGMSMAVQRKLRPDAFEIGGYIHQLIGRTFDSIQTDLITLSLAFLAVLWITRRYLFRKPQYTGIGEYLLCAFFSLMQLLNASINETGSVQTLYENSFQMVKAILYLLGMFVIFLCAFRALNELIHWQAKQNRCKIWDRHPFVFPVFVLAAAWLPYLIIKFPGSLTIDTVLQYHQYVGYADRTTPHPPFGTLIYGFLIDTALNSEYTNWIYFGFTLIKTIIFICVLSYILSIMNRHKIPMWICWGSFVLFAVSPVYVGWTTAISKDSSYLILCMLIGAMLLDNIAEDDLDQKPWKCLVFGTASILLMLIRHNGMLVVAVVFAVMLLRMVFEKKESKRIVGLICYACAVMVGFLGIRTVIYTSMGVEKRNQDDWMSLMFQQTARVVCLHDDEIPQHEKEIINRIFVYDEIKDRYSPECADSIRWNYPEDGRVNGEIPAFPVDNGRSDAEIKEYIRLWWEQFKRYPMDYLDAVLAMNGILFDLQENWPYYTSLTNHSLDYHVYHDSFNDMTYYDSEQLRPFNGLQRALTEWMYRAHEIPLVGQLASMGFCVELMIAMVYFSIVRKRGRMLPVMIPAIATAVMGLFCAIVYTRYLLPTIAGVPLWFAAWYLCEDNDRRVKR